MSIIELLLQYHRISRVEDNDFDESKRPSIS